MVAHLVRLRWTIVIHQLRRDWWRLLFVIAGAIWSLSIVPSVAAASIAIAGEPYDTRRDALVLIAALIGAGWVAVPLLATGVDDALDPVRFGPWGLSARRLMPGLTVAAFTTVPAVFFVAVAVVLGFAWRGASDDPGVLVMGLVGAVLTAIAWVVSARVATLWAVRLLARRAAKALLGALVIAAVAAVAWAAARVGAVGLQGVLEGELSRVVTAMSWSPAGAGFAAPAALVEGDAERAWVRLAIESAWVGLLWLAWSDGVGHALINPLSRSASVQRTRDALLDAANSRVVSAASRTFPMSTMHVAAVAVRTARSWRSDPRYITQAVGAIVIPSLVGAVAIAGAGGAGAWIAAAPVALAISIGWGRHNDLAYDAGALWLDIVSSVRGRSVLTGRLVGTALWSVPAVIGASLLVSGLADRWDIAAATSATAVGVLGASLGVASFTSVLIAYPVPAPGESPFGQSSGAIGASLAGQVVSSLGTGIVVPIVAAPLLAAIVWGGWWHALAVAMGLSFGIVAPVAAARAAGRIYDSRSAALLSSVR